MRSLLTAICLVLAGSAGAHTLAPALLDIQADDASHYTALWRIDIRSGLPDPAWPESCQAGEPKRSRVNSALETRWSLHCPAGLGGETIEVRGLQRARTAVLLRVIDENQRRHEQLLSTDTVRAQIPLSPQGHAVWLQYTRLGIEHILAGVDHLLLVVAVFLLATGWRALLLDITAFTLGHSLTLAAAGLGGFWLPGPAVELAIAISLLWLALDLSRGGRRPPWPLFATFGLIHGLGFAGALRDLGLPANAEVPALLCFNLGIEAGQVLVLAALAGGHWLLRQRTAMLLPTLRWIGIYAVGSLGGFWFLQRGSELLL